jgi:hypothetical protein
LLLELKVMEDIWLTVMLHSEYSPTYQHDLKQERCLYSC